MKTEARYRCPMPGSMHASWDSWEKFEFVRMVLLAQSSNALKSGARALRLVGMVLQEEMEYEVGCWG